MNALRTGVLFLIACVSFAACSSSGGNPTPPSPFATHTPTATASPTPSPTPTTAPATIATSVALNSGAALVNAPVATSVPAPAGYAQSITVPIVNAAASTTITVTAGASPPAAIAPLSIRRSAARVRQDASGNYNTIFYDSVMPSANVTVAGQISYSESFPNGGLVAGTGYYLAFYDTTVASPAWQTIVGPVQESNNTLTFTGTTSSFTLVAGKLYGFAIFSVSAPAASPPPAPQTDLYFGDDNGLNIADENGNVLKTLAIPSQTFDLDDAGNVYANYNHEGGTAPNAGGSPFFAEFPAGTTSPNAPYLPTANSGIFVSASGAGQAVAVHNPNSAGMLITDIWDPGVTGAPSRTITTNVPTGIGSFAQTHDGTLYLPDTSTAGAPQFDVFPPGATTPSRVIPETIVPSSRYADFAANYAAVGPDGTLYVTEYSFNQPDPSAGVYIYPTSGAERFIPAAFDANGPGPQGVDVDGAGNIYVVNNNDAITAPRTCQGDSLASVSVYSPSGTLMRTIPGIPSAFPITVAADGTAFVAAFPVQLVPACAVTGSSGIYKIAPGASTATMISTAGSSEIVLYDGTHKTEPFARSSSHGVTFGGRGARIRRPTR